MFRHVAVLLVLVCSSEAHAGLEGQWHGTWEGGDFGGEWNMTLWETEESNVLGYAVNTTGGPDGWGICWSDSSLPWSIDCPAQVSPGYLQYCAEDRIAWHANEAPFDCSEGTTPPFLSIISGSASVQPDGSLLGTGDVTACPGGELLFTMTWIAEKVDEPPNCVNGACCGACCTIFGCLAATASVCEDFDGEYHGTEVDCCVDLCSLRSVPTDFNLSLEHVEFTQAIQDESNSVPLIRGKPMLVRAYVGRTGQIPANITNLWDGQLSVFPSASATKPSHVIRAFNGRETLTPEFVSPWSTLREDLDNTLNFFVHLPADEEIGRIVVEINPCEIAGTKVAPYQQIPETNYADNALGFVSGEDLVWKCTRSPRVVHYFVKDSGVPGAAPVSSLFAIEATSWMQDAYPVSKAMPRIKGTVSASNLTIVQVRGGVKNLWHPLSDGVYLWVPDTINHSFTNPSGYTTGCGTYVPPGTTTYTFGQTDDGGKGFGWVLAAPDQFERTFAHELAHALLGSLALPGVPSSGQHTCFAPLNNTGVSLRDGTIKSVSLYGMFNQGYTTDASWITVLEYNALLQHLEVDCPVSPPEYWPQPPGIAVDVTINPDGTADIGGTEGEFAPIPAPLPPPTKPAEYSVSAYGVDNALIVSQDIISFAEADPDSRLLTVLTLPDGPSPGEVERLELVRNSTGEVVGERLRSSNAPIVSFVNPVRGGMLEDGMVIAWSSSDEDGDALNHTVLYAWDDSGEDTVLLANSPDTSLTLDTASLPGSAPGAATLRLIVSDGLNTTELELGSLTLDDLKPPTIWISAPLEGSEALTGTSVVASALVTDLEDLEIPGDVVEWSSNVDGLLATGSTAMLPAMSLGDHVITARVIDSDMLEATATVSISIVEPNPPCISCGDLDADGIRDDQCQFYACNEGVCEAIQKNTQADLGGGEGDCPADGACDGNDRFHALNCFANLDTAGNAPYPCEDNPPFATNVDAGSGGISCELDGICDGNDAFHALNCFANINSMGIPPYPCVCSGPLPTQQSIQNAPRPKARLSLRVQKYARPGHLVEVDVYFDDSIKAVRGYQLHAGVTGGTRGSLELVDINTNRNCVFSGLPAWDAFNLSQAQMLAGLDDPAGIPTRADGYLATFIYRVPADASGTFVVDLLHDRDAEQPVGRTFLFGQNARPIDIGAVAPAIISVVGRGDDAPRRWP